VVSLGRKDRDPTQSHAENCTDPCCAPSVHGKIYHVFSYGFGTLPRDIGRALLVGLAVAALISAVIPKDYFAHIVPPGILQMLVLMAAGIPVYVCATASIPLAYALILTGVSPGAAFAFLMTGPATNAATISTIWKVMGRRTTIIYLATMIAAALLGGLLLDQIVTADQVTRGHRMGWMLPPVVKHASGVVLVGVLLAAVLRPFKHALMRKEKAVAEMELKITGMTCTHCQTAVRRALLSCPGVTSAEVDLEGGRASVSGESAEAGVLCEAVEELGYSAEHIAREDQPHDG
jgi:copper chaperone CopZ